WPNAAPTDLMTMTFDIAEGASGSSTINLTSSSNAAGFTFDGQSHDVVISTESEPSESETMASQLSIDSATGVVTLAGEADYQTVPNYNFTVTAANGADSAEQTVGLLVADQLVSSAADAYTGTDEADVFALTDGSAQVTSGAGEDMFVLASSFATWSAADIHTLVDFESGVDSIDASAALMSLGYTGLSSASDGGAQENKLSALSDVATDILDLVSNNDTSLDNVFGNYFDDASHVLTLFVDTDSAVGSSTVEAIEIAIGEGSAVEDDDLALTLEAFIA
ncbi:MAG: cadherin repeat domain-containing protein, partial [Porticoccaceae bacterium]|nr:cadherin repeat domain-containing protein [Porticoccaceae bacterium]